MKRNLMLAIIAVFLMMPFASFARTALSDKDLAAVTAQEGVSIFFDNYTINNVSLTTLSWGNGSGFGTTYTGAGYVGASNITIAGNFCEISGIETFDVGTNASNVTAVRIGLPTITYGGTAGMEISATLKLDSTPTLNSVNASTLGVIDIKGFQATITGSITISPH